MKVDDTMRKRIGVKKQEIIRRYISFCTYGHFIREGQKVEYVFNSIFCILMWFIVAFLLSGSLFRVSSRLIKWIGIVAVIRMLSSSIECKSDIGIDYSLSSDYPISNFRILLWRIVSRCMQVNEWFYLLSAFSIFLVTTRSIPTSIMYALVATCAIGLFEETVCLISYRALSYKKFFVVESVVCLSILASVFFIQSLTLLESDRVLPWFLLSLLVVASLGFLFHASEGIIGARTSQSKRAQRRQKRTAKHKKQSTGSILLSKELSLIFRTKIDIIISAASLSVFFIFTTQAGDVFIPFLPTFFILDFATSYIFNYYGAEKEDLLITLLAPIDYQYIIRAKNIAVSITSLLGGMLLMLLMLLFSKITSFSEIAQIIAINNLSTAIMLVAGSYLSIRYYHSGKRNPFFWKELIITIGLYALLAAFVLFLSIFRISTVGLIIISLVFLGMAITVTIIVPDFFANLLYEKETDILYQISQN